MATYSRNLALESQDWEKQSHQWKRLYREFVDGRLLPVVGAEAVQVELDGRLTPLYEYVAEQVAEQIGVELNTPGCPRTLAEVAYRFRQEHGNPDEIYYATYDILTSRQWSVGAPLEWLAEIDSINLFVSTTPDNLLAQAIDNVRFGGEKRTRTVAYAPQAELLDLASSDERGTPDCPIVFKLFGDIDLCPDFVVTEEDTLEFVHRLQIRDERPTKLFDILKQLRLAMLGCSFPDWLYRFFLCSAKGDAMFNHNGVRGVVADRHTKDDAAVRPFLERNQTLVLGDGDATDFLAHMHRLWKCQNDSGEDAASVRADRNHERDSHELPPNAVFISYAHEDLAAAERIKTSLEGKGIPVWLDKSQLQGGDLFEAQIHNNIKECVAFIAVLSKHTLSEQKRFFRLEWSWAIDEARMWPESHPFIQPITIDDAPVTVDHYPREFCRRHQNHFPDGRVEGMFLTQLQRMLGRHRRRTSAF